MQARRRRLTHDPNPAKRRYPLPVDPAVAGTTQLTQRELEQKLGTATFQVWMELCTVRDSAGRTHVTLEGLARMRGFDPLSFDKVKRAMMRLIEAGIVEPEGWQTRDVPRGMSMTTASVYVRRVRGAPLAPGRDGVARVVLPRQIVAWVRARNTWGGRRAGAGRKKTEPCDHIIPPAGGIMRAHVHGLSLPEANQGAPKSNQDAPPSGESRCTTDRRSSLCMESKLKESSPSEKTAGAEAAPRDPLSTDEESTLQGAALSTSPAIFSPLVPPRPTIATPRIPAPPEITTDDPDEIARILGTAYREGMERVWPGTKSWSLRGAPRTWKQYAMLVTAGRVMREHGIAPAAWVLWSAYFWRKAREERPMKSRSPHPPVAWMFSSKRIEERRGWFASEDSTMDGRLCPGPKQRALVRRYAKMMLALGSPTARADEVVARWFPPGEYERQVDDTRREAAETQALIARQIREGVWLW